MSTGPHDDDPTAKDDSPVETGTGPNEAEPVPDDPGDDEERFDAG